MLARSVSQQKYKFSICYENVTDINGYITEKIFDCFKNGTIPIYLGANDIFDYIPRNTMIHFKDYDNYSDLKFYLEGIDRDKFSSYQNNIKEFLNSNKAKRFDSKENAKLMVNKISNVYLKL